MFSKFNYLPSSILVGNFTSNHTEKLAGGSAVEKRSPIAKCDPLRGRAIQHDHQSRPMGDPSPARWEHDQMENMQILC